jgi:hypothetical protein
LNALSFSSNSFFLFFFLVVTRVLVAERFSAAMFVFLLCISLALAETPFEREIHESLPLQNRMALIANHRQYVVRHIEELQKRATAIRVRGAFAFLSYHLFLFFFFFSGERWFKDQEEQQRRYMLEKVALMKPRLDHAKSWMGEEQLQEYYAAERGRVRKMQQDLRDGLDKALQDFSDQEEKAILDLKVRAFCCFLVLNCFKDAIERATEDLKKGEQAAVHDAWASGDLKAALDIDDGLREAEKDLTLGERRARYDYRQGILFDFALFGLLNRFSGIYKARRDLREADEKALSDLELDDTMLHLFDVSK